MQAIELHNLIKIVVLSHTQVFYIIAVLENVEKLSGKSLQSTLFSNKVAAWLNNIKITMDLK